MERQGWVTPSVHQDVLLQRDSHRSGVSTAGQGSAPLVRGQDRGSAVSTGWSGVPTGLSGVPTVGWGIPHCDSGVSTSLSGVSIANSSQHCGSGSAPAACGGDQAAGELHAQREAALIQQGRWVSWPPRQLASSSCFPRACGYRYLELEFISRPDSPNR